MKNLKSARIRKNLTQKELSNLLGFNEMTISNYENGKTDPAIDTLVKLSKTLDVSIDYLLGNTEEKTLSSLKTELDTLTGKEVKEILIKILDIISRKI